VGAFALAFPFVAGAAFADPPVAPRSAPTGAVPASSGPSRATRSTAAIRPVNLLCPVMTGTPVDPAFTSVWEGKLIGFSSADAKGRWDRTPATFARNLDVHALDLFNDAPSGDEIPDVAPPAKPAAPATTPDVAPKPRVASAAATPTASPPPAAARANPAPRTTAAAAAPAARTSATAPTAAPSRVATPPAPRVQAPPPRPSVPVRQPATTRWVDPTPEPCVGGG
jgi:hypothetical protein